MNRHIQKVPTLSNGRKLAGLLAIPIFIAGFLETQTFLNHLTPYPVDIFRWIAIMAGILAGGAWVSLIDNGLPHWLSRRLFRAGQAIGWVRPEIRAFIRPLSPAWRNATRVGLGVSLLVWVIGYFVSTDLLGYDSAPIKPADQSLAIAFSNIAMVVWVLGVLVAPDVADWVKRSWRR